MQHVPEPTPARDLIRISREALRERKRMQDRGASGMTTKQQRYRRHMKKVWVNRVGEALRAYVNDLFVDDDMKLRDLRHVPEFRQIVECNALARDSNYEAWLPKRMGWLKHICLPRPPDDTGQQDWFGTKRRSLAGIASFPPESHDEVVNQLFAQYRDQRRNPVDAPASTQLVIQELASGGSDFLLGRAVMSCVLDDYWKDVVFPTSPSNGEFPYSEGISRRSGNTLPVACKDTSSPIAFSTISHASDDQDVPLLVLGAHRVEAMGLPVPRIDSMDLSNAPYIRLRVDGMREMIRVPRIAIDQEFDVEVFMHMIFGKNKEDGTALIDKLPLDIVKLFFYWLVKRPAERHRMLGQAQEAQAISMLPGQ